MPHPSRSSKTSCATSSTSRRSSSSSSASDTAARYGITQPAHPSTPARRVRASASRCSRSIQAAKAGDWTEPDGVVTVDRRRRSRSSAGEYELVLETTGRPEGEALALLPGRRLRAARHHDDARARGRGPRPRRHPRRAGHAQGGRLRRQRPHPPASCCSTSHDDADAVASAFDVADVAGETLAVEHAVLVNGHGVHIPADAPPRSGTPSCSAASPSTSVRSAGTYANRGGFHVAVTRIGGIRMTSDRERRAPTPSTRRCCSGRASAGCSRASSAPAACSSCSTTRSAPIASCTSPARTARRRRAA